MTRSIFITGGHGYIGHPLISRLRAHYRLRVLEHHTKIPDEGIKIITGSLESKEALQEALHGVDTIIHLAGATHAKNQNVYHHINTEGTRALIKAAETMSVKQFIFVSTRAIGNTCGAYGASKAAAEDALRESTLNWKILRVAETYDDDWSSQEGINKFARQLIDHWIVPFVAHSSITFAPIHRDDVIAGIEAAIKSPYASSLYTLAGPEILTWRDIARRITKRTGTKRFLVPIHPVFAHIIHEFLTLIGMGYRDQWERLVCNKEGLSDNVKRDLGIQPRAFLKT